MNNHIDTLCVMQSSYAHIRKSNAEWEAIEAAKDALKEIDERRENKPLTVKQIKERMGQAMWMKIIRPNKEPWVDRVFISAFGDDVVVNRGFGFKFLIVGDGERFSMKEPRLSDNEIEIYDWRPDGADLEEVVKQRRGTHD